MEQAGTEKRDPAYWRNRESHYGNGLVLLLVAYVFGAIDLGWLNRIIDLLFVALALLMVQHPAVPRPLRIAATVSAVISVAATLTHAASDSDAATLLNTVTNTVVISIAIIAVLLRLFRHTFVNTSTVMGAVLAYALFAFASAGVYQAMQTIYSEPFFDQGVQPDSDFVYFSFIVLTTVGFGDLTPAGDLAKRLVAVEALIGQIFLVVLVSRLVSLWKPPKHHKADPAEDV